MEMGSNDIMGEPEENTRDEGHEEADPDTEMDEMQRDIWKLLKDLIRQPRSWVKTQVHRDECMLRIKKNATDALIPLRFQFIKLSRP